MPSNPLNDLIELEKDARAFGFDWPNVDQVILQIHSECSEVLDAIRKQEPRERIQEEVGDLLHVVIYLCLYSGFDLDQTVSKICYKFGKRMQALKEITRSRGLENLQGQSMDFMLELWREAKSITSNNI